MAMKSSTNKNGFKFIAFLIVSLFSVCVTAVSTMAWFQISNPGKSITEDHVVTAADPNLTIDGVTGYKVTYDELDANTTDYSSGHVNSYKIGGNTTATNINQGKITGFDVPSQGVGYYLSGNDVWTVYTMGMDFESAWKYEASIRMDDDVLSGTNNKAMANSIYLNEGTEFKVRHHYYYGGSPHDDWISASINTYDATTNTNLTVNASGNIEVNAGYSGYYNIYLLNDNKVHVYFLGNLNSNADQAVNNRTTSVTRQGLAPRKASISNGSHFFFHPSARWRSDNAHFVLYVFNNNKNYRYRLEQIRDTEYYYAKINSVYDKFILLRYNPNQNVYSGEGFWVAGEWNRIGGQGVEFGASGDQLLEMDAADDSWSTDYTWYHDTSSTTLSSKLSGITNVYDQDWYYILGDGTVNGSDLNHWDKGSAIKLSDLTTDGNHAQKYNVTIESGTVFKVKKFNKFEDLEPLNVTSGGMYEGFIGYHNEICTDMSLVGVDEDNNVVMQSTAKVDVYVNSDDKLYIFPRLDVTEQYKTRWKEYTSTTPTTTLSANWVDIQTTNISYNTTFSPSDPSSLPNHTWCNAWYQSDGSTAWSTSTALTTDQFARTYFDEDERLFHVKIGYTNTAATEVTSTSGDGQYNVSNSTTISNDALKAMRNALSPDTTRYVFKGFYWSTDTSLASAVTSISSNTLTSEKTIYAVYRPADVVVSKYVTYWIKNSNSTYTSVSSYFSNTTEDSATGYKTENFAIPASVDTKYRPLTTSQTLGADSVSCLPGVYKFKFDAWYTTADCSTEYSPVTPTGAMSIYARVYMEPESDNVTLYADAKTSNWWSANADTDDVTVPSNASISAYHTQSGSQFALPKVFGEGAIFKVSLPNNDSNNGAKIRFIKTGETQATAWWQTIEIATGLKDSTTSGAYAGKNRGECTLISIWKNHSSSTRFSYNNNGQAPWITGYTWNNYYGEASGGDGYYLVGTSAFTGSTGLEWSFGAARKMTTGGTAPTGFSGTVLAHYDNLTLSQGMEFKIWQYSDSVGKGAEYYTLNSDPQTSTIAFNNGSGNVQINTVDGTRFSVYLMGTDLIVIIDNDQAAYIFFDKPLHDYDEDQTVFEMGYGDHTTVANNAKENLMIYETGIRITEKDIENGVSFAVRDKRSGATHWYYYDCNDTADTNHGIAGDDSLLKQGAAASSQTYGDSKGYLGSGNHGFAFDHPGFYRIYLTRDGYVSAAPYPGSYGEGYYIVPYNENDSGPNKTDYYSYSDGNNYYEGVKMKDIPSGYANIAVYTYYTVTDANRFIFFRAYLSGKDVITNKNEYAESLGGNEVYCASLVPTTLATMHNGVLEFTNPGSYNIYLTKDDTKPNGVKCAVEEYSADNFFKLNSVNNQLQSQAQIKDANTSLVLEVDFTTSGATTNMEALVQMIATGTGSSQYLAFTYAVINDISSTSTEDNYRTYDNPYEYMRARYYIGESNRTGVLTNGSHKMFILIDYDHTHLGSVPTNGASTNDFYFVLTTRQIGAN